MCPASLALDSRGFRMFICGATVLETPRFSLTLFLRGIGDSLEKRVLLFFIFFLLSIAVGGSPLFVVESCERLWKLLERLLCPSFKHDGCDVAERRGGVVLRWLLIGGERYDRCSDWWVSLIRCDQPSLADDSNSSQLSDLANLIAS